jgi:hypothetical protein
MADISKHPLIKQAYEVCRAIEAIKDGDHFVCSPSQTEAVTLASKLMNDIDRFVTPDSALVPMNADGKPLQ